MAGVVNQNSAVYHDAADTGPQTDVSVLWTIADEVLKLQREARNYEPVARFQALTTSSLAHILHLMKPFHKRPKPKCETLADC